MKYFALALVLFSFTYTSAQQMPSFDEALAKRYTFVRTIFNRIQNSSGIDSLLEKLFKLKSTGSGRVSIVHIGDSHIQADFMTSEIRNGLQDFFGNAGRGLVFPYQLAQSNGPDDIHSYSSNSWQFNRLTHPEITTRYGISGFGIKTSADSAGFTLALRNNSSLFNQLKLFTGDSSFSWIVKTEGYQLPAVSDYTVADSVQYQEIIFPQAVSGFSLTMPSGSAKEFYGVSLENSGAGILYHSIGVNGARYDQYNAGDLFWQQLPALKADLYIISLGTNEAQFARFSEAAFARELAKFIQNLRSISPGASLLITTAPDSYKDRRFNTILQQLNNSLAAYCEKNFIPFWDLYHITNGYGSASNWSRRGLMSRDRIHFTPEGYRLQGDLLLLALAKAYNNWISIK